MDDFRKGRYLVFLQFGLILMLAVFPDSASVDPALEYAGLAIMAVGLVILFAGFRALGKSLTANPVPNEDGLLVTKGIFTVIRHPIYIGLLIITFGLVISSGVWLQLIVWLALAALLGYKMRWEEELLNAKFKGYAAYKAKVPAVVPGLRPKDTKSKNTKPKNTKPKK